jgi:uncharacterized repeat protein (TIGR03803 family)
VAFVQLHRYGLTSYSFQVFANGDSPSAALVQGSDGYFYGTTSGGGENGGSAGTVFKISATGALTSLYSFTGGKDGGYPSAALVQGSDGNFFGTTSEGGTNGAGTVFKVSTNGALTSLYSFTGGDDGANPTASMVQGSDGSLYGIASGGTYFGTIFRITTGGVFTLIYSFTGADDGAYPEAALIQANDGYFYGTASAGGISGLGTVFRVSANGAFTSLFSFNDTDGATPAAALFQAADGYLYGTTTSGTGRTASGTVFRISTKGAYSPLYLFTGGIDGGEPDASLIQASDGNLYGTTAEGGTNGAGTVFQISTNGSLTSLYSFTGGDDGARPEGLVQGNDGYFYGTTEAGGTTNYSAQPGTFGAGTVFKISRTGSLASLYSFHFTGGALPNGLVEGSDGNFYGTTSGYPHEPYGYQYDYGTVFQLTPGGTLTSLYSFTGGNDGANPFVQLVEGSDGYFYGTTLAGGTSNAGTVFKISANGALTTLYSFTGGKDGFYPNGLAPGSDGYFYGTTGNGGTYQCGTVFQISAIGALTTLYSFTGAQFSGLGPIGAMVEGSDGYFYGTTQYNVFKISTNGALTTLYSFVRGNNGLEPNCLAQGSDGFFYGTTGYGGATFGQDGAEGDGTVFKVSSTGAFASLYSFTTRDDGVNPDGLVQGGDGYLYGTTEMGGPYDWNYGGYGTVFRISTNGRLTSLYAFTGGNDGANPSTGLMEGSDGRFYGATQNGGAGGAGTVFRLTIVPEFQAMTLSNGTLSLTWSTEAGGTYQLQYNSDLSSSTWTNLGGPSLQPDRPSAPPTPSPTALNGFTGWCSHRKDLNAGSSKRFLNQNDPERRNGE